MLAVVEITPWYWVVFIAAVVFFLALDLGFFHRKAHVVKTKEALAWTGFWLLLALIFAGTLFLKNRKDGVEFFTGYFIEVSLSMDNVFVIALIFAHFQVPAQYQHRVLFWGVLGALAVRGLMIGLGVALITRFEWILYVLGGFIVLTGIRMLLAGDAGFKPGENRVAWLARRILPIAPDFDGQKFFTRQNGRRMLTPLFLVLLLVETADVVFAVDSIPAIFGVTRQPFIVFSSNVFAILGLRSLYFVLAGAMKLFRYLNTGLAVVLVFIGAKMLIDPHDRPPKWFQYDIPDGIALATVLGIIAIAILLSLWAARREAQTAEN
jgi:tellurite resistance protein TerC